MCVSEGLTGMLEYSGLNYIVTGFFCCYVKIVDSTAQQDSTPLIKYCRICLCLLKLEFSSGKKMSSLECVH